MQTAVSKQVFRKGNVCCLQGGTESKPGNSAKELGRKCESDASHETSADFLPTTRWCDRANIPLHDERCENLYLAYVHRTRWAEETVQWAEGHCVLSEFKQRTTLASAPTRATNMLWSKAIIYGVSNSWILSYINSWLQQTNIKLLW
jgi:hypothetical protein